MNQDGYFFPPVCILFTVRAVLSADDDEQHFFDDWRHMAQRLRQPTIFEWIAIIAGSLVVLRMIFPALVFDNHSMVLLSIAAIALGLPKIRELLPPLKRLKYGDFEAEFNEAIDRLEERVNAAEQIPSPRMPQKNDTGYPALHETYVKGFNEILSSRTSNTEKILAAAILAESMLTETAKELQLTVDCRFRSPSELLRLLAREGFISEAERDAFNEFWQIRNAVVHGRSATPPTDEQTARVLDLLWRLVRILG